MGDPIEVEAVSKCLIPNTGEPLLIGSVKTNFGHGEAVSGLTSIIKSTLALENMVIPPTIGIQNLNPHLKLDERNMKVVTDLKPWPVGGSERISVNSFGYGGANAHAILDSARMHVSQNYGSGRDVGKKYLDSLILPFSAHNSESLTKNIEAIMSSDAALQDIQNVAYTLGSHRSSLPVRGFVLASEETEGSITTTQIQSSSETNKANLPMAFIFTGQGAQWPQMGRKLLSRFPAFGQSIDTLDSYLASLPEAPQWSLRGKSSPIDILQC